MPKVITNLGEFAIIPRQGEVPVRETLEFLTDVMESHNGEEYRIKLRSKARQTFSYTIPLQANHIPGAFNTEYGAIRKPWAVPLWTEPQYIGTVYENQTEIMCNTEHYDFRFDSLAMLYTSCDAWQVLDVNEVKPDRITLWSTTQEFRGAWLVPVRIGYISNVIDRSTNGYSGKSTVTFEIEDTRRIEPTVPSQYLGHDVYVEPGLLTGEGVDRVIEQRLDENDFELGNVDRRTPWKNARVGTPYRRLLQGVDEVFAYRDFFYRRAGRFKLFWMPSFEINMRLISVSGATLVIHSDSYIDYASLRGHLAIQVANSWYFLEVLDATQTSETTVEITLSTSLLNVKAKDVKRICYAGLYRLDSDLVEINWQGNNVADVSVRIMEIYP